MNDRYCSGTRKTPLLNIKEFFEDIWNGIVDFYLKVRGWVRYHTKKDFFKLLWTVLKGYPWDYSYMYELERAKLVEMIGYQKRTLRFVGVERVIRDMELCVSLIDIITERKQLFTFEGEPIWKDMEDKNLKEFDGSNIKYKCLVNVNTRNAERFFNRKKFSDNMWNYLLTDDKHEIYKTKARYLYEKIRLEHMEEWWD